MNFNKNIITLGLVGLLIAPAHNLQAEIPAWLKAHGPKIGMALLGVATHYAWKKYHDPRVKETRSKDTRALADKARKINILNHCLAKEQNEQREAILTSFDNKWENYEQSMLALSAHTLATFSNIIPMLLLRNPYFCAGEAIATVGGAVHSSIRIANAVTNLNAFLKENTRQNGA